MRILGPVATVDEAGALVQGGADELYCGLFPQGWYERWGRGAWPNRRGPGPGNVGSEEDLLRIADAAHLGGAGGHAVPLYVTLNQQFYADEQADYLLEVARRLVTAGGADAFVVSDPGFAVALLREVPGSRVFASSVAVALNSMAVRLLAALGCSRVIVSRHLDLRELAALAGGAAGIELEAFVLNDNCRFEEGFCGTLHSVPGFGVYCITPWEIEVRRRGSEGGEPPGRPGADELRGWDSLLADHREYLAHLTCRGLGGGRNALPLGPCGLCAIPDLVDIGIAGAKVVGREASLYRKLRCVQVVRHLRDLYLATGDAARVRSEAVALRSDPDGCARGWSCYYRSARPEEALEGRAGGGGHGPDGVAEASGGEGEARDSDLGGGA